MRWLAIALLATGCLQSSVVVCEDGRRCPVGTLCEATTGLCVLPSQLEDCRDQSDGTACIVDGLAAECQHGLCLLEICGDGIRSGTEECDALDLDELGCDDAGFYEAGALSCDVRCNLVTTTCVGRCGDGAINGPEVCDGGPPAGSCLDHAFDAGTLGCTQCVVDVSACVQLGWQPAGHPELDGIAAAGSLVVGVGELGQIARWNGTAWAPMTSPVTSALYDVAAASETLAWAVGAPPSVGAPSTILRFDGASWSIVAPPQGTTATLRGVWASTTRAYAVGDNGTVLAWDGTAWTRVTTNVSTQFGDVIGFPGGHVIVVGNGRAMRFDGTTWTLDTFQRPIPDLGAVWGAAHDNVWASGSELELGGDCTLRHWNGLQWSRHECPFTVLNGTDHGGHGFDLFGTAADDIWGARLGSPLMRFDGTSWTSFVAPADTRAIGGRFGELFHVGADAVYRWPYHGWNERARSPLNVRAVVGRARDDIFVVGDAVAAHWDGKRLINNVPARGIRAVVTSSGAVFTATAEAVIWRNGGGDPFTGWETSQPCPSTCVLTDLAALGDSVAVIASGTLYITSDAGTASWQVANATPGAASPRLVWGTSVDDHAIVTDDVYRVTPSGAVDLDHPDPMSIERLYGAGAMLLAAGDRRVHRHDGTTWIDITPAHVAFPRDPAFHAFAPDDIFVVGEDVLGNGVVMHWDGTSWAPIRLDIDVSGGLWAPDGRMLYVAAGSVEVLDRTVAWH